MKVPIGEWIQQQRGAHAQPPQVPRFTQRQLAQACNTDVGNVSRWERGLVVPKADAFLCLCELFGIDPAEARKVVAFVAPNALPSKKALRAAKPDENGAEQLESGELPAAEPAAGSL